MSGNPNPLNQESIESSSVHQYGGSGAPHPSDSSVFKVLGIYHDPRMKVDFDEMRAKPEIVLDHHSIVPDIRREGPILSGRVYGDGGKDASKYVDRIEKGYRLNNFDNGYGKMHFHYFFEDLKTEMHKMPTAFAEASISTADWDQLCNQFCQIRGRADRKDRMTEYSFMDAPFKPLNRQINMFVMLTMTCTPQYTADDFYDKDGNEVKSTKESAMPCIIAFVFSLLLIPLYIIATILQLCFGPDTGPSPQNLEYLEAKFSDLTTAVETVNIEATLETELKAFADEINQKYNPRGIYCAVRVERDAQYHEYTCICTGDGLHSLSGHLHLEGDSVMHHNQFLLYFYKN